MVFSSIDFIFRFLPVFLLIYAVCPFRWKNLCLFAGSLFFYYSGVKENPSYLFLFLCSIGVNYIIGILIGNRKRERKKWLVIGIIYNFFWLFLFKYSGFFIQNLNGIVSFFGLPVQIPAFAPVLPIGISFYTFQNVSYLADVYRRRVSFERSFTNYGMYISMSGARFVQPADLFRFLWLLADGERAGKYTGISFSAKLLPSVFVHVHDGILEKVAYNAGKLVPGICLYSFGGEPGRLLENDPEPSCGMAPDWILAWSQLEFYFMGTGPVPFDFSGKAGTGETV